MCDSNLMDSKTKTFESLIESIEKNEEINLDTKDVLYKSLFENSNLSFFEKAYSLGKNFESFEDSKKISYINDLIYGLYKNLPYEQFNKTIGKLWLENSLGENLEKILDKDPTIVASDTIDGEECLVVEYSDGESQGKMWISKEHGIPLRVEPGETSIDLKYWEVRSIDLNELPEEAFTITEDMKTVEVPNTISR